jgi:hypothetical protein
MTDPKTEDQRHADFVRAVELLGGQHVAVDYLDISPRNMRYLIARERNLHSGYMRDITTALRDHARKCTELARRTDPLFTANRTASERMEKARG